METEETRALPKLAFPFAIVGATAGFFSILALGFFKDTAKSVSPWGVADLGALAGLLVGLCLERSGAMKNPMVSREGITIRAAALVVPAAAILGGIIGLLTWGMSGVHRPIAAGALVGACFVPIAVSVVEAARNAARARQGSIVSDADGRTVWSTLLTTAALSVAVHVPALASGDRSERLSMTWQVALGSGLAFVSAVALFTLWRREHAGIDAVLDLAHKVERDAPIATNEPVDLGLGSRAWTQTRSIATYRRAEEAHAVVLGSFDDALRALRRSARSRAVGMIAATAVMLVHLPALLWFEARNAPTERAVRGRMMPLHVDAYYRVEPLLVAWRGTRHRG